MNNNKTIFEKSQTDQIAYSLPKEDAEFLAFLPSQHLLRQSELALPEISEIDLTRHFSQLAHKNMGIDTNFYPLGSCTMKLNPRVNEKCAALSGFRQTHPLAPSESVQGNLQLIHELLQLLCKVCGLSAGTLLPAAGAQGEYVGVRMMAAYHQSRGDDARTEMLVPDSAHGTNPATAAMARYKTVTIRSASDGDIDINHLESMLSERTAGLMLTNPNTFGLFSPNILKIAKMVHDKGGLLFYDGANLNAILNVARPGDMGFDVMHLNLHKTFSTPHGGGGPGSGPVLCNERLQAFLPVPRVSKNEQGKYEVIWDGKTSIGKIASFHGNFAIYLRAYLYILLHGDAGLRRIAEQAVLNANYLKCCLKELFKIPFQQHCMHEFVVQADRFLNVSVRALDLAKRLLDYGLHAPTVYFPLNVKECMLIEPTECESLATLDAFLDAFKKIVEEVQQNPEVVKTAPHRLGVSRLDEVYAAKHPVLHASEKEREKQK